MSPTIEISPDLYVALRTLMEPGDRTPSDVIWRLVEGQHVTRTERPSRIAGWVVKPTEGLSSGGATIPNELRLRGRYKSSDYTYADIRDGKLWVGGEAFASPSAAATAVSRACGATGPAPKVNGWKFWEFETPRGSDRWRRLDSLRGPGHVRRRHRKRRHQVRPRR